MALERAQTQFGAAFRIICRLLWPGPVPEHVLDLIFQLQREIGSIIALPLSSPFALSFTLIHESIRIVRVCILNNFVVDCFLPAQAAIAIDPMQAVIRPREREIDMHYLGLIEFCIFSRDFPFLYIPFARSCQLALKQLRSQLNI